MPAAHDSRGTARWGQQKLAFFRQELKRLGRKNRIRVHSFYRPFSAPVSKASISDLNKKMKGEKSQ